MLCHDDFAVDDFSIACRCYGTAGVDFGPLTFGPGVCGRHRARMWCGLVGFVETSKPGDFSEGEKYSSNIGHLACKGCIERSVPHSVGWRKPLQEHLICNHVTRKPKNCTWRK